MAAGLLGTAVKRDSWQPMQLCFSPSVSCVTVPIRRISLPVASTASKYSSTPAGALK